MTRPKLRARTCELELARARLGVIIRDMLELQKKHGAAAAGDRQYLEAAQAIHARYQDWMHSLEPWLRSCKIASQQQIITQ
jgi:hypothetical protein